MDIAKVFQNGNSQIVKIPRKYQLSTKEVSIRKQGNQLILTPVTSEMTLEKFLAMPAFPDFELDRNAGLVDRQTKMNYPTTPEGIGNR